MSAPHPGNPPVEHSDAGAHPAGHDDATPERPVVNSVALFAGGNELAIRHNRAVYYLRQTRFGKLILTK